MSTDGFMEFNMGEGDEAVGKRNKRFTAEAGRTYRITFVSFSKYGPDGLPTEDALIKYVGCDRIYIKGVGNVLADNPALSEFGQPKQSVATIICVWPTDKEGELDAASFTAGKGWTVQPWIFSADKYQTLKISNKKFSFRKSDLSLTCSDGTYQKMTFGPENECLLNKYLESGKPQFVAVAKKIIEQAKAMAATLQGELAKKMTPQQVREALGGAGESPAAGGGGHASKDVDDLLNDVV